MNEGTSSQKLMLFIRGKAMSGAPIISGTIQLPKPADHRRHDHEEHHDQAVRGDQHVPVVGPFVELRGPRADRPGVVEHLDARFHQLPPHDPGNAAADHSGDDREDQIERADVLVVGRHEPAGEEARLVVGLVVRVMRFVGLEVQGVGGGAH